MCPATLSTVPDLGASSPDSKSTTEQGPKNFRAPHYEKQGIAGTPVIDSTASAELSQRYHLSA